MNVNEIIFIALGLAMDAFAVSICKGISIKKDKLKASIIIGAYFGVFQALMPLLGYFLGIGFEGLIKFIDHWIAFILLGIIGINMIKESKSNKNNIDDNKSFKVMIILAIATSIDALTVGITFAFLNVNILLASFLIGIITFILSAIGVQIGNNLESKFGNKAEFVGGLVLIIIGTKILLRHLNIF